MKKLISSMLAASLLTAAGAPAFAAVAETPVETIAKGAETAEGTLDARLSAVTKAVKSALSIGDDYPEFYGEPSENDLAPRWSLSWSNDSETIRVTAGEDGKVYSYNYNLKDSGNRNFWGFNAAFPKADKKEALAEAQAFADRLMGDEESVVLEESYSGSTDSLSFTGVLRFHGLPSPVDVRVEIRAEDLAVTYFRRDDSYSSMLPGIPAPDSSTTEAQAAELLRSTVELTPYYVLNKDGKTASLRYLRENEKQFIVTAADGKLVDLEEVYADLVAEYSSDKGSKTAFTTAYTESSNDAGAAPMASSGDSSRLSDSELKTIDGMKDVHSKEQLDQALRGIPALGLDSDWTFEQASYSQDRKTGDISAQLRYTRPLTAEERKELDSDYGDELLQITKTIRMDARTDALQSVYTGNYYDLARIAALERNPQTEEQKRAAEQFLEEQLPEKWNQAAPYSRAGDRGNRLQYAQEVNGYLFPNNVISIRMDADLIVDNLNVSWDKSVSFENANGMISGEDAVSAYMNAFEMPLSYVEYPVLENGKMAQKYVLAYAFRADDKRSYMGIDAKTGEPVWETYSSETTYRYQDLDGAFGREQIETLAEAGIGLAEERFRPDAELDQKTMLLLLLSACGYRDFSTETEEGLDNLYSTAYSVNLATAADREPEKRISRMEFVRTMLGASIYGDAAKVKGVYLCPFTDQSEISQADLGYAALASGLGVALGDDKGKFFPQRTITRQEAAVMLYNFMMR